MWLQQLFNLLFFVNFLKMIDENTLNKFEELRNIGLIGATNAGKTHKFKQFMCDKKFPSYDEFIFCGNPKDTIELSKCYCASEFLNGNDWTNKKMTYFNLNQIERAISYCDDPKNASHLKLLLLDDALIQGNKAADVVSNFLHQSKNAKTTVVVAIHVPTGAKDAVKIRAALNYLVVINESPEITAKLMEKQVNDPIIKQYNNKPLFDKFLIKDKVKQLIYNDKYMVEGGLKNYHNEQAGQSDAKATSQAGESSSSSAIDTHD